MAAPDAKILILGSMPGVRSLQAQRYYAHPRNAFWPIMAELLNVPTDAEYRARIDALRAHRIALWDVLDSCYREGSLDSAIRQSRLRTNDFAQFLEQHPRIDTVFFNGATAERIWLRHVVPELPAEQLPPNSFRLPSTSPAYAAMRFEEKRRHWSTILDWLVPPDRKP